jgi:hypothetical protein
MIGNKRNRSSDERLDQLGRDIIRVSASNETEAEEAAVAPFLYTRLRSRINSERERRRDGEGWLAMLGVAWRAVPAMALVAIFAFALFISANFGTLPAGGINIDDALLGAGDAGVESVVFADNRSLSNDDDILATILNEDVQEASR